MSITVMVVDHSALMRKIMSHILREIDGVKVSKTVSCKEDAAASLKKSVPDLIMIDAQMPDQEGLNLIREINKQYAVPIIMICSSTEKKETTLKALELGAKDFILKPKDINKDWILFKESLEKKIRMHCSTRFLKQETEVKPDQFAKKFEKPVEAIVIGASTGGPKAIIEVIKKLPKNIGIPIFIVQHMPEGFTASFANRLNTISDLSVVEAADGEKIKNNSVYLAPGGKHMIIDQKVIVLTEENKIHGVRPAVDFLFESAANKYKNHLIGVVLTGMGNDGARGSKAIKDLGGYIITQDQETSVIYGMPRNVNEKGYSDEVVSVFDIGERLKNMIG